MNADQIKLAERVRDKNCSFLIRASIGYFLADWFESIDPAFDRRRFVIECGLVSKEY